MATGDYSITPTVVPGRKLVVRGDLDVRGFPHAHFFWDFSGPPLDGVHLYAIMAYK